MSALSSGSHRAGSRWLPVPAGQPTTNHDAASRQRPLGRVRVAAVVCGHDPMGLPEAHGRCRDVVPELIIELL